ncbi:TonB-dependent hemoglobin/transferrin/lactoferrin family receptor [Pseudochelatococcus lubricantis]|uniref:TonB-dependent hemoglobin/transferrin/lactoferrin family receptor n=1 Tax=Pseudochelatococcus lubricantis TaxID=1538102 RepID=UPI0035F08842
MASPVFMLRVAAVSLLATVSMAALSVRADAQTNASRNTSGAAAPAAAVDEQDVGTPLVLDTVTVVATRTRERLVDTLAGASVVTRDDIALQQSGSVSELLRNVPGVTVQLSQDDPAQAINIRGLQDFGRVNVLVDGARQNFQTSGHGANGVFYLDPELIGSVDIVRGPVSNIYGSGAIGGVASFTTRGIDDLLRENERYGAEQKTGYGSNGSGFLSSTAGGFRIGTAADVYGQFVFRDKRPYNDGDGNRIDRTGSDLSAGLFKFNVRPAEGHTVSGTALYQDYTFENGSSTVFRSHVTSGTYTLGYTFSRPDVPWLDLSVRGYYAATKNEQRILSPSSTFQQFDADAGSRRTFDLGTYGIDIHNTARFSTGPIDHALTFGVDGVWDDVTVTDQAGGFGSAFTPGGKRNLFGGFIQDELRYNDWLRVIGALRFDSYDLDGNGFSSSGDRVSPKITVGVTPVQGIELYATYAEGYRAPSISETLISGTHPFPAFDILPNPDLKPETAHNIEGGVNISYDDVLKTGDKVRGKINVYRNDVDDYIDMVDVGAPQLTPVIPGMPASVCRYSPRLCIPLYDQQYQNIAKARLEGAELEAAYDWGGGFITLAAARTNGKNRTENLPLASAPPARIGSTVGLRFFDDKLTVGARWTYFAAKKSGSTPSEAYHLVDVFASYAYNENVRADFSVQNLFDQQYTEYRHSQAGAGLTAKGALTVRFASY